MAQTSTKQKASKYKYVMHEFKNGKEYFVLNMPNVTHKRYKTEKEAGIAVDLQLIKQGKEPVNVLIRA